MCSMISAQCDELRAMAESVGLAVPQAATLMMEAADTIDRLDAENAKLRDSIKALMIGTNDELCAYSDEAGCKMCSMHHGEDGCTVVDAMELLGIDMYGEPLGIEVE